MAQRNIENTKVERFRQILDVMFDTYVTKNSKYGDSFGISVRKYGLIAGLTRISDKFNRMENIILGNETGSNDETLLDTLLDLANYAVMLIMEIENNESDAYEET